MNNRWRSDGAFLQRVEVHRPDNFGAEWKNKINYVRT